MWMSASEPTRTMEPFLDGLDMTYSGCPCGAAAMARRSARACSFGLDAPVLFTEGERGRATLFTERVRGHGRAELAALHLAELLDVERREFLLLRHVCTPRSTSRPPSETDGRHENAARPCAPCVPRASTTKRPCGARARG